MRSIIMNIKDKELKYKLKDCLNDCNLNMLKNIYENHKSNKELNLETKEDYIEYLEKKIPLNFKKEINNLLNFNIYKILKSNNEMNVYNDILINSGFMFHYCSDDYSKEPCNNIIPEEIQNSSKKIFTKEFEKDYIYKVLCKTLLNYILASGYIPKEELEELILNSDEISVTKEDFNKAIKDIKVKLYNNCYTYLPNELFKVLEDNKINYPYKYIDIANIEEYNVFFQKLLDDILDILEIQDEKIRNMIEISLMFSLCIKYRSAMELADNLKKEYNLCEEKKEQISELIYDNRQKIRFWDINGSLIDDYNLDICLKRLILNQKPKDNKIISCLKEVPNIGLDLMKNYLDAKTTNIKDIEKQIFKYIKNDLDSYSLDYLVDIVDLNEKKFDRMIYSNFLLSGYVFLYKEGNEVKILVSKEMQEIIKKIVDNYLLNNDIATELINKYIKINGVLSINKIQELLRDNHDIDLSLEEIIDILVEENLTIIDNEYVTFIAEITPDNLEDLLSKKRAYGRYKKVDLDEFNYTKAFLDELDDYLNNSNNEKLKDFVVTYFYIPMFLGMYNRELFKGFMQDKGVLKYFKSLDSIAMKYKNKIGIWTLNGYTLSNKVIATNNKIGRNEKCPCGSGLKYKHCCGK